MPCQQGLPVEDDACLHHVHPHHPAWVAVVAMVVMMAGLASAISGLQLVPCLAHSPAAGAAAEQWQCVLFPSDWQYQLIDGKVGSMGAAGAAAVMG